MTWIYILIAAVLVGLIIWMFAKKKKGGSQPPSGPPSNPPGPPAM
jgi:LPXTG-motif cell wall-anchored protein